MIEKWQKTKPKNLATEDEAGGKLQTPKEDPFFSCIQILFGKGRMHFVFLWPHSKLLSALGEEHGIQTDWETHTEKGFLIPTRADTVTEFGISKKIYRIL